MWHTPSWLGCAGILHFSMQLAGPQHSIYTATGRHPILLQAMQRCSLLWQEGGLSRPLACSQVQAATIKLQSSMQA